MPVRLDVGLQRFCVEAAELVCELDQSDAVDVERARLAPRGWARSAEKILLRLECHQQAIIALQSPVSKVSIYGDERLLFTRATSYSRVRHCCHS